MPFNVSKPFTLSSLRRQIKARLKTAKYYEEMCAALKIARLKQGKNTGLIHYRNEAEMLNRLVLAGKTARQWLKENRLLGDARDNMNAVQLERLIYLEIVNTRLINSGLSYQQRKIRLTLLARRYFRN